MILCLRTPQIKKSLASFPPALTRCASIASRLLRGTSGLRPVVLVLVLSRAALQAFQMFLERTRTDGIRHDLSALKLIFRHRLESAGLLRDVGSQEDEQFGFGRLSDRSTEQSAHQGNIAEEGGLSDVVGLFVLHESADDDGLTVMDS